ncbi:uncharacterized protein PV09_08139 [Verruconis gallopava]|uniref:Sedoheptulose-1,7-bisphosphatase n=1 Tax=Verruconis gallopava TaxID=253628 RepID=A0A0D2A0Q6_9PEZI|nr:uncharacterized protein PV09_08139 [Verruconis gallopava]KIW00248.1 hypothetical protein PV09_08139 [Verruconis gallopava]
MNTMTDNASLSLSEHLTKLIPGTGRRELRESVLPTLLRSIIDVSKCLRSSLDIRQAGSINTSGDSQLNVDLATNEAIHSAIRTCPSIVAASSEEDEGESPVKHIGEQVSRPVTSEQYAVAFDPLDGSSIIPANWAVGTIIGIWDGKTGLNQDPRSRQIAAILGVLGPRTTALVALRLPESGTPACFEVGLDGESQSVQVLRSDVRFLDATRVKTRYFAPANLRAAAQNLEYASLVSHFIRNQYTLRYSGGLVPDVVHALIKGHGIYISPVTSESKAKLRRLYELAPIALLVECAGGKAVDPSSGVNILDTKIATVEDKAGLVCGATEEVDMVMTRLKTAA